VVDPARLHHHPGFGPKSGLPARPLHVWLPREYSGDPAARFPVLYLHDGQNCFDAATAFAGREWEVDETCDRLVAAGVIAPRIVVAIENSSGRMGEYSPSAVPHHPGSGRAAAQARRSEALVAELECFAAVLAASGSVRGDDFAAVTVAGAVHDESAGAARLEDVLRFLFARQP